jgi:type II secretory pathway pseudopilin PulG
MAVARRGFTIVELLVAVTTFTVLAFLTVTIVGNLADLQVSRRSDQQVASVALGVERQLQDIASRTRYEPAGSGQRVWTLPIIGRPGDTERALLILARQTGLSDTQSTALEWNLICTPGQQAVANPVGERALMLYTLTHVPGDTPSASVSDCTPNQVINRSWTARTLTNGMYVHAFTAQTLGTSLRTASYQFLVMDAARISDYTTLKTDQSISRITVSGYIGGGSL